MITVNLKKLGINPGYRILDIGCGSGRHTGEAVRFKDTIVIGTDINYNDLLEAKKRMLYLEEIKETRGTWNLAATDITQLPFYDNYFDLVICSEVLEHIPNQHKAISEIIRVLKPDKNLIVSVPRYLPEKICWLLSYEYRNSPGGHVRIYKKKQLADLLENSGVKKWHFHYAHSLHAPYWWLKCLLGLKQENLFPVKLYHKLLVWDMMEHPKITCFIERLFNPVLGKSIVLYLKKE